MDRRRPIRTASLRVVFVVLSLVVSPLIVLGHPQCLDFRPAFVLVDPPLSFCSAYTKLGCCDWKRDLALKERHATILEDLRKRLESSSEVLHRECHEYLKDLLCAECSPYAAHVFEAESNEKRRSFPGLCREYSSRIYQHCQVVIPYVTSDPRIIGTLENSSLIRDLLLDNQRSITDDNNSVQTDKRSTLIDKMSTMADKSEPTDKRSTMIDNNSIETDKRSTMADNSSASTDKKSTVADNSLLQTVKSSTMADNNSIQTDRSSTVADNSLASTDKKSTVDDMSSTTTDNMLIDNSSSQTDNRSTTTDNWHGMKPDGANLTLTTAKTDKEEESPSRGEDSFYQAVRISDETYCFPDLLTNPRLIVDVVEGHKQGYATEGCVCLQKFAKNLRNPILLKSPRDSTGRLFIAEQIGQVHVFLGKGERLPDPFLDITHLVDASSRFAEERGLLGMTFHPNFKSNGRLFVYYTGKRATEEGGRQEVIRISELRVNKTDANRVNETSERVILEIVNPYWNQNGGEILFGLDGFLYIFTGDGGSAGDPHGHAQNRSSLLGKVLRIDVDRPEAETEAEQIGPYGIPEDNPFRNETGSRPEVYAYGIRNSWRCDVDEGHPETGEGRGRILCGEVGQSSYEEVNWIKRGANYGWSALEGPSCFKKDFCEIIGEDVVDPIFSYPHSPVGQSIIGGHVYRGCLNENLRGHFVYGDFMSGKLFQLIEETGGNGKWRNEEVKICAHDVCTGDFTSHHEKHILSFGEDEDGELYMMTTTLPSPTSPTGAVYKVVDPRRRSVSQGCVIKTGKDSMSSLDLSTPSTSHAESVQRSLVSVLCLILMHEFRRLLLSDA